MIDKQITFEDKKVRRIEYNGEWYFSVVDVVAILTYNDYQTGRKYWNKLKERLKNEGSSQSVTNCHQLKLEASDGKTYKTDCANIETMFRIIQSIPSLKAEPIKQWLAKVGYERMQEIENPEIAQERMMEIYRQKGYSSQWIEKRIQSIIDRKELTNEWDVRGALKSDYAIFTALMSEATFGVKPSEHKEIKGLKRENLRDHMTRTELVLVSLGEVAASEIHRSRNTKGRDNLKKDIREAGDIAGNARKEIEAKTSKKVLSSKNHLDLAKTIKKN